MNKSALASHDLDLMLARGQDRRRPRAHASFPMITEEGLVLTERRSGHDRRHLEPAADPEKPNQH
ncbi:hypothetical protein [Chitinolyticbacter meiyuanensis]|uniref:hypothetical protein n=1 Tax=Chitinolyticbacter meiyuanensis TaxID=682798 RepID=UPI0011E5A253|nr:hypothetical protein [Chitinolyticbacter meiyuanensis]